LEVQHRQGRPRGGEAGRTMA